MKLTEIQENLEELIDDYSPDEFIYDLLRSYGLAKASITRLKKGEYNLSDNGEEVIWKNKVYYKEVESDRLHEVIDELSTNKKVRSHDLRFIIVTDHERLLAEDTKTKENRDIAIGDLPKHFDFFLPWAGMEKRQHVNENPADVKAAEKLAKLFDEIKKNNTTKTDEEVHSLNVFLSRLLFCFFAEDTGIFDENLFTNSVSSHTKEDGSDLDTYFKKLFAVLNDEERKDTPAYLNEFPYVNGGLFKESHQIPELTRKSRQILIECGELDWAAINPDIFGSMMQAVITPDQREGLGIHYTSVPNIMKVIEPLFLDDLYDEFEENKFKPRKLHKLLDRISKFKIFDPACGSGNFLIIAYKQLRYFEIKVLKQLRKLQEATNSLDSPQKELIPKSQLSLASSHQLPLFSRIQLSQFYGIEIDDFAHEIAQLSLWLAEHQMNAKFYEEFGQSEPTLPLKETGKIVNANACRIDWNKVCQVDNESEIFVLGNPPYLGARLQNKEQKKDISYVFKGVSKAKNLDYISCWFKKGADYINGEKAKFAFVTTNSIAQGEQVSILWPEVFKYGCEIFFANPSFKWKNNAKNNAAVIVSIIGVSNNDSSEKVLYRGNYIQSVDSINPYLVEGDDIVVKRRRKPLSDLPEMSFGSMANDGGNLVLSKEEKEELINKEPAASRYIKKFVGSKELINEIDRYCIWIEDHEIEEALNIKGIKERVEKTKKVRLESKRKATRDLAAEPHKFGEIRYKKTSSIIVPRVSSERRDYVPISFLDSTYIISDSALSVYEANPWHFSVIISRMHMKWLETVGGRLKSDYRYSTTLVYNNFPFPKISDQMKEDLNNRALDILREREKYSEKKLSDLYDPDKMPDGLREAHHANDLAVDHCYQSQSFENDEERLETLFDLYEEMLKEVKN